MPQFFINFPTNDFLARIPSDKLFKCDVAAEFNLAWSEAESAK